MKKGSYGPAAARYLLMAAGVGGLAGFQSAAAQSTSASVSVVSDYRFRGISQTFRRPALQAGVDYAHDQGFYVGSWGSTVDRDFLADTRGLEWDIYGGYRLPVGAGWIMDVGLLQYLYPGETLWNTTEAYVGGTWEWLSIKYSQSVGNNTFGFVDSRGSGYFDLTVTYPLNEGLILIGHAGHQRFRNNSAGNYSDYRLGVNRDWAGFTWGASIYGTDQDFSFSKPGGKTRDLGRTSLVLSISRLF